MPDLRDTGAINPDRFDDPQIQFYDFYRLDFGAPTGTKRYTNKPGGYVGDIDGTGSQTWTEYDVKTGRLAQGRDSILEVSWIDFGDLDNEISELLEDPGILFVPATIYRGHFNVDTNALLDSYIIYEGRCDEAQVGTRARISLIAHRTNLGKPVPGERIVPLCQHIYKGPRCASASGLPDCPKTPEACAVRANTARFGGFNLVPPAQLRITWGNASAQLAAAPVTVNWGGIVMLVEGGPTYSMIR